MKTISIFFIKYKYCTCVNKKSRLHFFYYFKIGINMMKMHLWKPPSRIYKEGKFLRWVFYYCCRDLVLECIRNTNNDNFWEKQIKLLQPICYFILYLSSLSVCTNEIIGIFWCICYMICNFFKVGIICDKI